MSRATAHVLALAGATTLGASLLAGCSMGKAADEAGTSVVAGSYPFAFVARRVAGDDAAVTNLTSPGAEPHDLELSPQQVAQVSQADVVVYERGFQPAVDDAVEENTDGAHVDVSRIVSLRDRAAAADPHVWQDPTKLVPVARAVADGLARADHAHAGQYRRNADRLVADLHALDRDFRTGLAHCARRTIVTSHAAFGHLARRYDLRMVSIAGLSPEAEPSPARLARLRDVVTGQGVTTVFSERLASPAVARTLAREVGVRTAVLDPIEGLTGGTANEDYFSLMRANLAALRKANGCR